MLVPDEDLYSSRKRKHHRETYELPPDMVVTPIAVLKSVANPDRNSPRQRKHSDSTPEALNKKNETVNG